MSLQIALLHGLHASPKQLDALAGHLRDRGHRTAQLDCATRHGIGACIAQAQAQLDQAFPEGEVSVVGFSFGGLVGRGLAHRLVRERRCRLLLQIATPNRGAAWAGRFFRRAGMPDFLGGVRDLVPGSEALTALPVPDCLIGIIAGTARLAFEAPITWPIALGAALFGIDEPGDGTVSLTETFLPGDRQSERLLLPIAHDHFPSVAGLHTHVAHFVEHRQFKR